MNKNITRTLRYFSTFRDMVSPHFWAFSSRIYYILSITRDIFVVRMCLNCLQIICFRCVKAATDIQNVNKKNYQGYMVFVHIQRKGTAHNDLFDGVISYFE